MNRNEPGGLVERGRWGRVPGVSSSFLRTYDNLRTLRACLLKEEFQLFWEYVSPAWTEKFMEQWCAKVLRSRIEPMKKIARMIRSHKPLILNWFEARDQLSLGSVEGMKNKLKASIRKSHGFRTADALKIALDHRLGALPEPELAHRFC